MQRINLNLITKSKKGVFIGIFGIALMCVILPTTASNSLIKTNHIESKYGFRIYYNIGNHYFPPHFFKNPFKAEIKQTSDNEIQRIIEIIDNCFEQYETKVLFDKFDAIYLADEYHIMERDMAVFSLGRNIYIAVTADGEKVEESLITTGLHREIHSILYDYYPNIISDKVWSDINLKNFEYGDTLYLNLSEQELFKKGFLSAEATHSFRADFTSFGTWHHTKKDELNELIQEYKILKLKHEEYKRVLNGFTPAPIHFSYNFLNKVNEVENEFGVKINIINNINNFPRLWSLPPKLVTSEQITEKNAHELLNIIRLVFEPFDKLLISSLLKKIYLNGTMTVNGIEQTSQIDIRSFYISSNLLENNDCSDLYINDLAYRFASIFRTNFFFIFPTDKWGSIGKNDTEEVYSEGFLSENGKISLNNDIHDYFVYYFFKREKLDSLSKEHELVDIKAQLFSNYYDEAIYRVTKSYEKEEEFILHLKNIKNDYGISIYWNYPTHNNDFHLPATLRINESINYFQAYRYIPIFDEFLNSFPSDFISRELEKIVLSSSMHYVNSKSDIGGTYSAPLKSIYLYNSGNPDSFLRGVIFHEFGHLILDRYSDKFPYEKWIEANPAEFKYSSKGITENVPSDTGEYYYSLGFISNYASYRLDEDFAELFMWAYSKPDEFNKIKNQHQAIYRKYVIMQEFLGNILQNSY